MLKIFRLGSGSFPLDTELFKKSSLDLDPE